MFLNEKTQNSKRSFPAKLIIKFPKGVFLDFDTLLIRGICTSIFFL